MLSKQALVVASDISFCKKIPVHISGFFNTQHHTVQWFTSHFDVYINIIAGDTLGGHLDDMEADWSKPIVSLRYYAYIFWLSRFLVSRYKHIEWKI